MISMKGNYLCCKNVLETHSTLLAHHIINVFAQFGWMSNNKYILYLYLTTPLIVLLHWKTNNNKCALTEYVNNQCNIKSGEYFRDMWFLIGVKKLKNYDSIQKGYLIVAWIITLVKVCLLYRSSASHLSIDIYGGR